jgi:hypothetical protein
VFYPEAYKNQEKEKQCTTNPKLLGISMNNESSV